DDEAALREAVARVRQRHRRLELRDVVVPEVADDGLVELSRFLEGDEPRAAADERVAAEPSLLDGFEQEGAAPVLAQVEVGRKRRQEVGVENSVHRTKNDPHGSSVERFGRVRGATRAGFRPARGATPTRSESES